MPPVTKADFDGRLAKLAEDQAKANKTNSKDYCAACSRNFSTDKAFDNHMKSKKHIESARKFDMKENKVRNIYNSTGQTLLQTHISLNEFVQIGIFL